MVFQDQILCAIFPCPLSSPGLPETMGREHLPLPFPRHKHPPASTPASAISNTIVCGNIALILPVVLQVLSPTYKQRNEDFRKLFKQLPDTERLIVGELVTWEGANQEVCDFQRTLRLLLTRGQEPTQASRWSWPDGE